MQASHNQMGRLVKRKIAHQDTDVMAEDNDFSIFKQTCEFPYATHFFPTSSVGIRAV